MTILKFLFLTALLTAQVSAADSLNYSGRLVNADGSPVSGPVNLVFDLVYTNAPTVVVCSKSVTGVTLVNGVFSRKLDFTSGECGGSSLLTIIEATPASESIAIKITDSTNSRVYAAQAVNAMPYSFMADVAKTLVQMGATTGQILAWNGTQWAPASAGGSGIGTITNIATGTGLTGGPITTTGTISIATGGVTTTQILDATIANIDVSTTAAIARTKLASGTASHVLVNDGSGVMSSVAQLPLTQGGTGATTASGARTSLGLGSAAVASIGTGIGGVMGSDAVPNCLASQKLQMSVGPVYSWTCATDLTFTGGGVSSAIDMNSNKITELASPTVGTDAANKAYVDAQIAGVPSVQWDSVAGGHINFAGGRVGIGDTTPSEALDVAANARVAGDAQVEGKLRLKSTTANYVELSAPAGLAATRSFTLPSTLGSSGEVLTTDGLGGLSWSAVSGGGGGGGSNWTLSSGDVYRATGNVGIGTTSPQALLQVQGATNEVKLGPTTAASGNSELQIIGKNSGLEKPVRLWSNWDGDLYVRPNTSRGIFLQDGTGTTSLNVAASGSVGIATTSPGSALDVKGELRLSGSSSGFVGFAPAATAGSTTYTLPSADGTTGYVLTTNGSGVLSWAAASGGGSTSVGGDLSGTVSNAQIAANAVGTTEIANSSVTYAKTSFADGDIPAAKVNGLTTDLAGKEASITAGTSAQYYRGDKTMQTLNTAAVPESGNLYFLDSRVRAALMSGYAIGSALPIAATDTLLEALAKLEGSIAAVQSNGQWTEGSGNVYRTSGNVGIGTTTPGAPLEIKANASFDNMYLRNPSNVLTHEIGSDGSGHGRMRIKNSSGTNSIDFSANAGNSSYINAGNVGIGITAPTAALHLKAGTTAANSAPLKFTAGPYLTTASDGAMEYDGTNLSFTIGATRYTVPLTSSSGVFTSTSSISNSSGNIELAPNLVSGSVNVTAGTSAVSSSSGALVVTGGVGVGGSIFSGGSVNAATNLTVGVNGFIPQLYGSTAAGGDILIDGTSNASKGDVLLATAGGNVGIGTSAPISKLHVQTTNPLSLEGFQVSTATNNDSIVLRPDAASGNANPLVQAGDKAVIFSDGTVDSGNLVIGNWSNTATGMRITSTGNVGIGTSTPTGGKLHVFGSAARVMVDSNTAGSNTGYRFNALSANSTTRTAGIYLEPGNTTATTLIGIAPTDAAASLIVNGDGNVGIGTTAPSQLLQVQNSSGSSILRISGISPEMNMDTGTEFGGFQIRRSNEFALTGWVIKSVESVPLIFGTNNSQRMTIDASGNVGIGVLAPAAKLDISGTSGLTLKITDGNQGAGKVLTSDANGVASWTAAASGSAWAIKTSAYTAAAGDRLMVDTSGGAVTVTLPPSATLGDTIAIIDVAGTFATNALTIARNGLRVMGLTEDMTVSTQNISFELVYSNATYGWRIK